MKTLINNVNILDVERGAYMNHRSVVIEDNRIISFNDTDNVDIIIDGEDRYLLPGMIDSHVHMVFEFKPVESRLATPFSYNFYQAMDYAKSTIDAGITTVRDALGADIGYKKAIEDGLFIGPRTVCSINALTITGGHGDGYQYSGNSIDIVPTDYPGMPNGICDGVEEVRKKAREMLRAGADVLKVHATGGVTSPTDHPNYTQFSLEELKVIVEEAAFRNGRKVMAHAQGLEGINQCIDAGIHSIEHGIYLDEPTAKRMVEHGTYLVPTLLAPVSVLEFAEELGMSQVAIDQSKEVLEDHINGFKIAYKQGVKIAMGTDAGVFKHGTNLRELELMVEYGMSEIDAIRASTQVAAECLCIDQLGLIKEGYLADLILVDQDPLENISVLKDNNSIKLVVKDGTVVKQID
ncbi:amidohydrolase family protein [Macrococcoides caseolyticum]|uniref:metal-dependent hydrolase family protein n=1 Tax=Macrococcoides caseolyticum TaxID=69966 RepID=UPI000C31E7F4|nr:amidohydrolase family protein [Macrococcus caseolyticus]MEB8172102.1 amidohydrolase family protein [Macrococcus caseolyticus]PKF44567.1 amidohydrolase family protein [Macrococcus caseolyticus]